MAFKDHIKVEHEDAHHMLAFSLFYAMVSPMPYNHALVERLVRTYWELLAEVQKGVLCRRYRGWVGETTPDNWKQLLAWMEENCDDLITE